RDGLQQGRQEGVSPRGGGPAGPHRVPVYFTRSFSSGTTHSGARPAATRWMLSKPLRKRAVQFSAVGPAECGVNVTLGSEKSGWLGLGGSSTITSSPAPAIRPSFSAV